MKRTSGWLALALLAPVLAAAAPPRFQKLTDHYFFLQGSREGGNVGAFVSENGILLVNFAPSAELPQVLEALKRTGGRPVRWVVAAEYGRDARAWADPLIAQGASYLTSRAAVERSGTEATPAAAAPQGAGGILVFGRQMRLYPGGVEVKLLAPEGRSRAGDVAVFVPAERVLQVGDLFQPGSFPQIEEGAGEGAALGWIEALKQVVDFVPLLKSAMPQSKPETAEEREKSLEEMILVIPGHGPVSNLQEMKSLLEQAQKLRTEMTRAIAAGRSRDAVVASAALAPFRGLGNFESFAARLYDALSTPKP